MPRARERQVALAVELRGEPLLDEQLHALGVPLTSACQGKQDFAHVERVADVGERHGGQVAGHRVLAVGLPIRLGRHAQARAWRPGEAGHVVVSAPRHERRVLREGRDEQKRRLLIGTTRRSSSTRARR